MPAVTRVLVMIALFTLSTGLRANLSNLVLALENEDWEMCSYWIETIDMSETIDVADIKGVQWVTPLYMLLYNLQTTVNVNERIDILIQYLSRSPQVNERNIDSSQINTGFEMFLLEIVDMKDFAFDHLVVLQNAYDAFIKVGASIRPDTYALDLIKEYPILKRLSGEILGDRSFLDHVEERAKAPVLRRDGRGFGKDRKPRLRRHAREDRRAIPHVRPQSSATSPLTSYVSRPSIKPAKDLMDSVEGLSGCTKQTHSLQQDTMRRLRTLEKQIEDMKQTLDYLVHMQGLAHQKFQTQLDALFKEQTLTNQSLRAIHITLMQLENLRQQPRHHHR